jgi:transposase
MLYLTAHTKVWLAIKPVDFRRQLDGLIALCQTQFNHNPRSGHLFVFINRSRTMIRVLCYEEHGYWLATKRLSRGHYTLWPSTENEVISERHASELTTILKTFVASKRHNV